MCSSLAHLGLRGRDAAAERLLNLIDRPRDGHPEKKPDERRKPEVVEEDAGAARDMVAVECVDAGSHRGGDDERQEEQGNDDPRLPEREGQGDDADDNDGDDEGTAGRVAHVVRILAGNPKPPENAARCGFALEKSSVSSRGGTASSSCGPS